MTGRASKGVAAPLAEKVRQRYARVAGFTFLFYIGVALSESILFERAIGSGGAAAKLTSALANAATLRVAAVLSLLAILSALALGIALFVVTRDFDLPVALAGLAGRVAEGIMGVVYVLPTLAFISAAEVLSEAETGSEVVLVVDLLVSVRETAVIFSATCFAAGSTAFSFLLLRRRAIPAALGWLGLLASSLLLIALPIQLSVGGRGPLVLWIWLPMLVFEIALSAWLLAKGVQPIVVEAGPPP